VLTAGYRNALLVAAGLAAAAMIVTVTVIRPDHADEAREVS
jgi:hypothetical protein